ncbi:unnamed protein product [Calypogeia fissa]
MAACVLCPSTVAVVASSSKCQRRRAPGVVPSWAAVRGDSAIQRPGHIDSCSPSPNSSIFGRSLSFCMISRGLPAGSVMSVLRCSRNVVCEVAVKVGDAQSSEEQDTAAGGVQPGAKIRVKVPLTVYHVLKSPNLNLEGLEGEVKEVLGVYKGKTISANLPIKVQFVIEVEGKPVKFFAHLKDDEFEVVE